MTRDLHALVGELRDALVRVLGRELAQVRLTFSDGSRLKLQGPFPGAHAPPAAAETPQSESQPFIPTPFQADILAALEGKALRTDALIAKLDCDRSRLYKRPGGIHELREHGLVGHHSRIGYYSVGAPPPELAGTGPAANG